MRQRFRWQNPATINGWALFVGRIVWVVLAAFGLFLFLSTLPLYYHHALSLDAEQSFVPRHPAEWRVGLHQLHLTPAIYAGFALGLQIVLTAVMFAIGLVIFLRRSNQWIGLFISIELASFGLVAANTEPVGFPAWLKEAADAYNNTAFLSFAIIPLVFPDGRFVPSWTKWVIGVGGLISVSTAFVQGTPLDSGNWPGIVQVLLVVSVIGTILLSPIYRYLRVSNRVQREQTKWVIFSLVLAIGVFIVAGGLVPNIPGITTHPAQAVLVDMATQTVVGLAFLLVPVGFAVAILRYKLWDIDAVINRTLVYGSLTLSLVALYIGGVVSLQSLFRALTGQRSDLAVAIATLAIAALFNPWRHRLQSFIDRRFYRRRYDAARTLTGFSARLRDNVDLDRLQDELVTVADKTMQPEFIGLWLIRSWSKS